jgi:photoactive yellow protein
MIQLTNLKTFVPEEILQASHHLTVNLIDKMPYGVVKVDDHGNILMYNAYNYKEFADFKGKSVIGKNYFTEIAPCANNFIFSGRFKRGVTEGEMDMVFDYVFTYKLTPTKVRVHLHRDLTGGNWIFVRKH